MTDEFFGGIPGPTATAGIRYRGRPARLLGMVEAAPVVDETAVRFEFLRQLAASFEREALRLRQDECDEALTEGATLGHIMAVEGQAERIRALEADRASLAAALMEVIDMCRAKTTEGTVWPDPIVRVAMRALGV